MLADAVGIKVGDRETRDIADIFAMTEAAIQRARLFRSGRGQARLAAMPEAELVTVARNREATARFGWSPYMHDPKLKGRLHRIRMPTLVLWGAGDRIVAPGLWPRLSPPPFPARASRSIERAGHFPHLEQPEHFAQTVFVFRPAEESAP